ncbi:MAG: GNAT family N-acetyltransferase [Terracidiphilus sp.]
MRAITGSLKQGEADIALFNHLRKDSPLYPAVLHQSGFFIHDFCPSLSVHRQLILPGSEAEFWAGLSPKMRRNLRWQIKKLLNAYPGSIAIECLTKLCDLEEMIRQLECIATKTYQRGLGVGFVDTPGERAFMQLKMKRGWLRTYILSLNGKPSAFWSGTLYQGVFHSDYMGYDPACRQYSPGIFLLIKVIEMFCCQKADCKIEAVDFGLGDAKYKSYFADSHWLDASLWIYAPTIRGVALNAYRTSTLLADRIARRIVGEELQEKIKKLWRSRSARIEQAHSASSSET